MTDIIAAPAGLEGNVDGRLGLCPFSAIEKLYLQRRSSHEDGPPIHQTLASAMTALGNAYRTVCSLNSAPTSTDFSEFYPELSFRICGSAWPDGPCVHAATPTAMVDPLDDDRHVVSVGAGPRTIPSAFDRACGSAARPQFHTR